MLNSYIEFSFEEKGEVTFLFNQIIKGIHSFIVYEEGSNSIRQSKIALSFLSKNQMDSNIPSLTGLRIFGESGFLEKLKRYPMLIRYFNEQSMPILSIPDAKSWVSWQRERHQEREISPSRRRRHNARGYHPVKTSLERIPYHCANLISVSTRQHFCIRIVGIPVLPLTTIPVFNAYGLALKNEGFTPDF